MASNCCREVHTTLHRTSYRSAKTCYSATRRHPSNIGLPRRCLSTFLDSKETEIAPRWAVAPAAMRAPFKVRPANKNDDFDVNEDQEKLDHALTRFVGHDIKLWMDIGVRWLAVTHKSFDHGRRGMNDKLAFLGRRIIHLQTTLALLGHTGHPSSAHSLETPDTFGRTPYQDESSKRVGKWDPKEKERFLDPVLFAQLASRYGLAAVTRWKPRKVDDLYASGVDKVYATTLQAVVGAVALQRGAEAANQVVQHRILAPLGAIQY